MQKPLLVLTICIILLLSAGNADSQWVKTGFPDSLGWVRALAVDNGILFAGTWGYGIHRSTDGGATWEDANNGLGTFYTSWVYDIISATSTGGGTCLYAGFEYGGIYRSIDDGNRWEPVNSGLHLDINILALCSAGTTLLSCVAQEPGQDGVYRSVNDGGNWAIQNSGFTVEADSNVYSFGVSPPGNAPGSKFFAGTAGGVFLSTSDGVGWTPASTGLPAGEASAIGVTSGFGGTNLFTSIVYGGVFRSTNDGSTWTEADYGFSDLSGIDVSAFAASPASPNIFAATSTGVYVSTNNGARWWETGRELGTAGVWPWHLAILGDYLFTGGYQGGGIWKYSTVTDTGWTVQVSGTADTLQTVKAVDNNIVWTAGTSGGVFRTTNGGSTWDSVGRGAIGTATILTMDALDANTAFVAPYSASAGTIYRTTNGGAIWTNVFSQTGGIIAGIRMKSSTEGYAVGIPVAGKWTVIKTTNGGSNWTHLPNEPPQVGDESATLGIDLTGNTLSFGTDNGKIYRSTDLGTTWTSDSISGNSVNALHFNSSSTGLAGFDNGITDRSTNSGVSWDSGGTAGSGAVNCISGLANEYWAIIGSSISYTHDTGKTWTYATPGFHGIIPLQAVSFTSAASAVNGWAVGQSGTILHYKRQVTGVLPGGQSLPTSFKLEQNYPNPFNPITRIQYELPTTEHVVLAIYDLLGRNVLTIVNQKQNAGIHFANVDGTHLSSGVYFCRMQAGNFNDTKKIVLLK